MRTVEDLTGPRAAATLAARNESVLKKDIRLLERSVMTSAQSSPDFPIPEGMEGFWTWDKMHCPRPQTPLTEDIFLAAVSKGFSTGMD